jgi:hypothetical protein
MLLIVFSRSSFHLCLSLSDYTYSDYQHKMSDANYLKTTVGKPLSDGIASIFIYKPDDPIEYLGHYLKRYSGKDISAMRKVHCSINTIRNKG